LLTLITLIKQQLKIPITIRILSQERCNPDKKNLTQKLQFLFPNQKINSRVSNSSPLRKGLFQTRDNPALILQISKEIPVLHQNKHETL
jgi:competence protein ComGF